MKKIFQSIVASGVAIALLSGCYSYHYSASFANPDVPIENEGISTSVSVLGTFGNRNGSIDDAIFNGKIDRINRVEYESAVYVGGLVVIWKTHVFGSLTPFAKQEMDTKFKKRHEITEQQKLVQEENAKRVQKEREAAAKEAEIRKKREEEELAQMRRVAISKRSQPTSARVYIDGKYIGQTNSNLEDVKVGTHTVELRAEGFAIENFQTTVDINGTLDINPKYKRLSTLASFPGGSDEYNQYIIDNVHYPKLASTRKISGRVDVSFVVTETGKIRDIEVTKSVEKTLDEEAMRVVTGMPEWIPATLDGEKVSSFVTIPIRFSGD